MVIDSSLYRKPNWPPTLRLQCQRLRVRVKYKLSDLHVPIKRSIITHVLRKIKEIIPRLPQFHDIFSFIIINSPTHVRCHDYPLSSLLQHLILMTSSNPDTKPASAVQEDQIYLHPKSRVPKLFQPYEFEPFKLQWLTWV